MYTIYYAFHFFFSRSTRLPTYRRRMETFAMPIVLASIKKKPATIASTTECVLSSSVRRFRRLDLVGSANLRYVRLPSMISKVTGKAPATSRLLWGSTGRTAGGWLKQIDFVKNPFSSPGHSGDEASGNVGEISLSECCNKTFEHYLRALCLFEENSDKSPFPDKYLINSTN